MQNIETSRGNKYGNTKPKKGEIYLPYKIKFSLYSTKWLIKTRSRDKGESGGDYEIRSNLSIVVNDVMTFKQFNEPQLYHILKNWVASLNFADMATARTLRFFGVEILHETSKPAPNHVKLKLYQWENDSDGNFIGVGETEIIDYRVLG